MKMYQFLIILFIIVSNNCFSQTTKYINYQAVVHDTNGIIVADSSLDIRLNIIRDSLNGLMIYNETHTTTTNSLGIINLQIGNGSPVIGSYEGINWNSGKHFLQTEIDIYNNGVYMNIGCNELISVPYALLSKESKLSKSLLLTSPDSTKFIIKVMNDGTLYTISGNIPVADFIANKTSASSGESIQFTDQSNNNPSSWIWNFGDGTSSYIQNPIHIYADTGIYTVSLTALNDFGKNTKIKTAFIYVDVNFCPPTITDIDGNVYNTILIGDQCWMKENLKVTHYPNGDGIPNKISNDVWKGLNNTNTDDAYCFYNNNPNNIFGAYYTYAAAIGDNWQRDNTNGQGICPDGWHFPTNSEWAILTNYLGGDNIAGGKMKEEGTLNWRNPNTGGTNESGFTALPCGYRDCFAGVFATPGNFSFFWTATENNNISTIRRGVYYNSTGMGCMNYYKSSGMSIRCVKD